jgi:NAD(P)-dependent dehydrogenase (short-subunit alcohol dehydrogenase family)
MTFKILLYNMTKTAIILGSTKGIGKATAALLTKEVFNVVVCSSQDDVDKTVEDIKSLVTKSYVG